MTKKRTFTVVFMKVIGATNYPVPAYYRQYKNYTNAQKAIEDHYEKTSCEAFIVRGDNRDSHKRNPPATDDNVWTTQVPDPIGDWALGIAARTFTR